MIFFNFGVSLQLASVNHGEKMGTCTLCGKSERIFSHSGTELVFHLPHHPARLKRWPMIGGMYHTIIHEEMAEALLDAKVTGFRLHKPTRIHMGKEDYSVMPPIPTYYLLEPIGMIDFIVPESEYELPCSEYGYLKPKRFGDPKEPFVFREDTWNGSDIVRIRNHWQHILFFNRRVIDLFRKNGWHHQIAYGQNGNPYESVGFGGAIAPGISVCNIDSDSWYEDTVKALKEKFPDRSFE